MQAFSRFCFGFGIAFLASITWPIVLSIALSQCDAWRWMTIEVTFSVIHPTCIAIAFGLFLASFYEEITDPFAFFRWPLGPILMLVLVGLLFWLAYLDLTTGYLDSYELSDPCTATKSDARYRAEFAPRKDRDFEASQLPVDKEYRAERGKGSFPKIFSKTNWITPLNIAGTVLIQLFVLYFIWCVITAATRDDSKGEAGLAISLLLALWIPARAFANICEADQVGRDPNQTVVIFAGVLALIVFAIQCVQAVIRGLLDLKATLAILGVVATTGTFLLTAFPKEVLMIQAEMRKFTPPMVIGVLLVAILGMVALVYQFLARPPRPRLRRRVGPAPGP